MIVTHVGHSCLLVEMGDTRILIDPGNWSAGFQDLRDLDAIVVTHQHADHLDLQRFPDLVRANPQAPVHTDPQTAQILREQGFDVSVLVEGQDFSVGQARLCPRGQMHAFNHDRVPTVTNVGVLIQADGEPSIYHPGDAYDAQIGPVDILAVPINAPWTAVRDTIDFVRRVQPQGIIPIHDALLSSAGRSLYLTHVGTHGGEQVHTHDLAGGAPTRFG